MTQAGGPRRQETVARRRKRVGPNGPLHPSGECDGCVEYSDRLYLDHKLMVALGGKHEKENLQWLCRICHAKKTNEENAYISYNAHAYMPVNKMMKQDPMTGIWYRWDPEQNRSIGRLDAYEVRKRKKGSPNDAGAATDARTAGNTEG